MGTVEKATAPAPLVKSSDGSLAEGPGVIELVVKFPLVRRADLTGIKFSR